MAQEMAKYQNDYPIHATNPKERSPYAASNTPCNPFGKALHEEATEAQTLDRV
jgi:hypothetical protein